MKKIVRTCFIVTGLLASLAAKAQLHSQLRTDGVEFIGAKSMELSQGEDIKPMLQELGLYLDDFKQELETKSNALSDVKEKSQQYYNLKNSQTEKDDEKLSELESYLRVKGYDVTKISEDKFEEVVKAKVSANLWSESAETSRKRLTKGWHMVNNNKSYKDIESNPKDHLAIKPLIARHMTTFPGVEGILKTLMPSGNIGIIVIGVPGTEETEKKCSLKLTIGEQNFLKIEVNTTPNAGYDDKWTSIEDLKKCTEELIAEIDAAPGTFTILNQVKTTKEEAESALAKSLGVSVKEMKSLSDLLKHKDEIDAMLADYRRTSGKDIEPESDDFEQSEQEAQTVGN